MAFFMPIINIFVSYNSYVFSIFRDMIRILFVDDHQVLIDGIKALLIQEDQLKITHEALDGATALELFKNNEFDVVLLDINLPDMNGFEICKEMLKHNPDAKIIALTMHHEAGYISKMVKAGVKGYLLKNTRKEELVSAIESVHSGETYFSKQVTENLISGMTQTKKITSSSMIQKVTRREKEILQLILDEKTTDEIAKTLFISSTTVISHRKSLLRKLNAKNTAGLVKTAIEFNILEN